MSNDVENTRESMLARLGSIKLVVSRLVYDRDCCWEFDILDSIGESRVYGNGDQWPCMSFVCDTKLCELKQRLASGEDVSDEEFLAVPFCREVCTDHDRSYDDLSPVNRLAEGERLAEAVSKVKSALLKMDLQCGESIFVYVEIRHEFDIHLSDTLEGLCDYFLDRWSMTCEYERIPYTSMTDLGLSSLLDRLPDLDNGCSLPVKHYVFE